MVNLNNITNNPREFLNNIELIKLKLTKLNKAYSKFAENKTNEQEVNMYFSEVMELLNQPIIKTALNNFLSELNNNSNNITIQDIEDFLQTRDSEFINIEIKEVSPIKLTKEDVLKAIRSTLKQNINNFSMSTVDELYQIINKSHRGVIEGIENSRNLPRKSKKKRKTVLVEAGFNVSAGLAFGLANIGGAVAESYVLVFPAVAMTLGSVALGGNRIMAGYNKITD